MNRDEARAAWSKKGLSLEDVTRSELMRLRSLINAEMIESDAVRSTLRCKQRWSLKNGFADLRCKAFYFEERQCITFESDGFVGFAGWADDTNIQPILRGFIKWLSSL